MGLLTHMTAMHNLHDLALNITTQQRLGIHHCTTVLIIACCVADKGVSNKKRLGMLRISAATASSAFSLMFLMPL